MRVVELATLALPRVVDQPVPHLAHELGGRSFLQRAELFLQRIAKGLPPLLFRCVGLRLAQGVELQREALGGCGFRLVCHGSYS